MLCFCVDQVLLSGIFCAGITVSGRSLDLGGATPTVLRRYFGNKKQTSVSVAEEAVTDKARETGSLPASVPPRSHMRLFLFVFLGWIFEEGYASAAAQPSRLSLTADIVLLRVGFSKQLPPSCH